MNFFEKLRSQVVRLTGRKPEVVPAKIKDEESAPNYGSQPVTNDKPIPPYPVTGKFQPEQIAFAMDYGKYRYDEGHPAAQEHVVAKQALLAEVNKTPVSEQIVGKFPAVNFMLGPGEGREAAFLSAASQLFHLKWKTLLVTHLYRKEGLFSGTPLEISALINYGEMEQAFEHKSIEQTYTDFPDTAVRRAVHELMSRGPSK